MTHFIANLIFALAALIIISYKSYEIYCIKNKSECSTWEAIKIYSKLQKNNSSYNNNEWPDPFRDHDERFTSAYRHFPSNIFHNSYDD